MSKIPFGKPFPGIDPVSLKEGMASGLVNGFINETAVDVESIPGHNLFVTLETVTQVGGIGTARYFNGLPGILDENNNVIPDSFDHLSGPPTAETFNEFTLITWLKADADAGGVNRGIAGRLFNVGTGWGVYVSASNQLAFFKDSGTDPGSPFSVPCPDITTQWACIAVTYSRWNQQVKFYYGTLPTNFTLIGQAINNANSFFEVSLYGRHIGDISNSLYYLGFSPWKGYLDNLRIYGKELTLSELITAMYPESAVFPDFISDRVDIIGSSPEELLRVQNTPLAYGYLVWGTTVLTGPGVGAGILAGGGSENIEVGEIDGLYETLSGVLLAVSRGYVFRINADTSYTSFVGDRLQIGIFPYFCEDGQHVYISHGGKIARVDLTNFTVELLNQNTPSAVTHICRSKGYLLCNGNDSLVTSSLFDLAQVFDNSASLFNVVVLYDKPGWILAAGQGPFSGTDNVGRLYLSKDNGITWQRIYTTIVNNQFLALEYLGGGVVLAGTAYTTGRIFRSTNYGLNWADLGQLADVNNINFIKKITDTIVIAGTGGNMGVWSPDRGRLFRSTDAGLTWTDSGINFGMEVTAGEALTSSGAVVAIASLNLGNVVQLWRSLDSGATFLPVASPTPTVPGAGYVGFIQRVDNLIAIMANGFVTGPQKIWRTVNQGNDWTDIGPIPDMSDHAMPWAACKLADGSLLMGTAGDNLDVGGAQIWKSIDGGLTWFFVSLLEEFPTAAVQWGGLKETHVAGTVIATGRVAEGRDGTATAAKWQTAIGKNLPQGDVFFSDDISGQYEQATSWERFNLQSVPDRTSGVFTHRGLVYGCGPRSTEMNYSSGDADFPWAVSDPSLPFGLLAPYSWVSWDELDTIMYLTNTDKGVKVVQLQGRQQKGISDEYDQILNDRNVITRPQDAKAWAITIRGLRFYVISFQEDNITLIYNLMQDHWARWAFWNGTEYEAALINAYCYSTEQNRHFIGDRRPTGKIFTMELTDLTDDGNPIVWEYTSGHVSRGGDSAKFPARYLGRYKRGYSIDNTVPEVLLSWRDDGRGPFSTERVLSLGATGDNEFYTHANRLGMYRLRQWRQRAFLSKCRLIFAQADES